MTGYFGAQKEPRSEQSLQAPFASNFAIEYGVFNKMKPGVSHVINISFTY